VTQKPVPILSAALPTFLTSIEVQSLLRVSKLTLMRYRRGYTTANGTFKRPVLGHLRREGRILFAKSEVEKFLTQRMIRA
jgi:hypothetical protein